MSHQDKLFPARKKSFESPSVLVRDRKPIQSTSEKYPTITNKSSKVKFIIFPDNIETGLGFFSNGTPYQIQITPRVLPSMAKKFRVLIGADA